MPYGPTPRPALARFVEKIAIDRATGCWTWIGAIGHYGYGSFRTGSTVDRSRRTVRAHRWAYEHYIGPIPDGLQLDHLCRNRACVNPLHLEPVTSAENTRRGMRWPDRHAA